MKLWCAAILVFLGCAGVLSWVVVRKVIPGIYASANVECVADWHAAISEAYQDSRVWPDPSNVEDFIDRIYVVRSSDGRRIGNGYMTRRVGGYRDGIFYDVHSQPMRWSREGDHFVISSAGQNGLWGDADDVSSDQVKEKYHPVTLSQLRAEAEAKLRRKK